MSKNEGFEVSLKPMSGQGRAFFAAERVLGKSVEMEMKEPLTLVQRRAFMKLPMQERRRILAEQAERVAEHYRQEPEVRDLGGGDLVDY